MSFFASRLVPTPNICNVVVRPHRDGGSQILVFLEDEVQELLSQSNGKGGTAYTLSGQPLELTVPLGTPPLRDVNRAVYEPTTGAVFYFHGGAVMQLDSNDHVRIVAGSPTDPGRDTDGVGEVARFWPILAMAADGKGAVFVAQNNKGGTPIRRLDARSGYVTTLMGSALEPQKWLALSYDPYTDMLMAATSRAIFRLSPKGGAPMLVAGHINERERIDGHGTAARFYQIRSILAGAGGTLYISDSGQLRVMDCKAIVSTLCNFEPKVEYKRVQQMAVLPGGELAISRRDGIRPQPADADGIHIISCKFGLSFTPSSVALAGRSPSLQLMPGWLRTITGSNGPCSASASSYTGSTPYGQPSLFGNVGVTVKVVGTNGRTACFAVHRNALTQRSEYFKQKLWFDSVSRVSGLTEVTLPYRARPRVFAWLLSYFYQGTVFVPDKLIRPAVKMALDLKLPEDGIAQLAARLLAVMIPGSVLSDLVWAERHNLTALVPQLKGYLLKHRREVLQSTGPERVQELLTQLMATQPELACELMCELLVS